MDGEVVLHHIVLGGATNGVVALVVDQELHHILLEGQIDDERRVGHRHWTMNSAYRQLAQDRDDKLQLDRVRRGRDARKKRGQFVNL